MNFHIELEKTKMRMKKPRKCFYPAQLTTDCDGITSSSCDSSSSSSSRRHPHIVIVVISICCPCFQPGVMENSLNALHYLNPTATL